MSFLIVCMARIALLTSETSPTCIDKKRNYFLTNHVIYNDDAHFDTYSIFSGFTKFSDLTSQCDAKYTVSYFVEFQPSWPTLIDDSFEKLKLIIASNFTRLIIIVNVKGIENSRRTVLQISDTQLQLILAFSSFDFYLNNTLIKETDCDKLIGSRYFFSRVEALTIAKVKYPKFLCPTIFKTSKLETLRLNDISNSLLKRNLINILEYANDTRRMHLNSINHLELSVEYVALDSQILSRFLFEDLIRLRISGTLTSIAPRLFEHFSYLRFLELKIENLSAFFHQNNSWMTFLNTGVFYDDNYKVNREKSFLLSIESSKRYTSFNTIYTYPDVDFCLFAHFPHEHIVIPLLTFGGRVNCSCTIRFLIQNNWGVLKDFTYSQEVHSFNDTKYEYYYNNFVVAYVNNSFESCQSKLYNDTEKKCDFTKMLSNCNKSSITVVRSNTLTDIDLVYLIMWLRYVLIVILQPILCFLGIINNILTILVIRNKATKKDFKRQVFNFLQANSVFNILYCGIMSLRLVNECISYGTSPFCSAIYRWNSVQYFKIVGVFFFGGMLKTCSSLSYICFSLRRILFISNDIKPFWKKFKDLKMKVFLVVVVFVGCLLNGYKLFQYRLNYLNFPAREFPYEKLQEPGCHDMRSTQCRLFGILKILDRSVNDIIFFLVNVILDIILFKKFKTDMENKKQVMQNHVEEFTKKTDDLAKMMILTGIINFISQFPQFISTILLISFNNMIEKFCTFKISCHLLNEIFQCFTMFSVVFQFYVLIVFNSSFKHSFSILSQK